MSKVFPKERESSFIFDPKLIGPCSNPLNLPINISKITSYNGSLHFLCFLLTVIIYGSLYMIIVSPNSSIRIIGIVILSLSILMYLYESRSFALGNLTNLHKNFIPISKFRQNLLNPPEIKYELESYCYSKKSVNTNKKSISKLEYSECKDMSITPAIRETRFTIVKLVNSRLIFSNKESLKIFQALKKKLLESTKVPSREINEKVKIDSGLNELFVVTPEGCSEVPRWLGIGFFIGFTALSLSWFYRIFLRLKIDQRSIFIQKRIKMIEVP